MIKLIVGLGNPGRQFEKTRHNAGFLFLDRLASDLNGTWASESRFDGQMAEIGVAGNKVLLLKPLTFMNRSGQAVGKVVRYYKLVPNEILVIHDELDFDPGIIKLKKDGGHAGHNGLRDIIAHLGTKEFYRLRIGIGRPSGGKSVADFVLSDASKKDYEQILLAFDYSASYIEQIVTGDIAAVMNKMNSRQMIR